MRRVLGRQVVLALAQDQSRGMFSEQTGFVPFRWLQPSGSNVCLCGFGTQENWRKV